MSWRHVALLAAGLCGCSDRPLELGDRGAPVSPPPDCADGEVPTNAGCVRAGVPDGCAPGEWSDAGKCRPAGVPPDHCPTGFTPADFGCVPVLPSDPCPSGKMALPGETVCREVAPCGLGTWGAIPVDAATQYVDASYAGASDGSPKQPWVTLADAIAAAKPGAIVAIAAGSYPVPKPPDKPLRLWGRCPGLVTLQCQGAGLELGTAASGSEVHDLAITGDTGWSALSVVGATGVVLDRLWLHDTNGHRGLDLDDADGKSGEVKVSRSLVERTSVIAVMGWGAHVTIDDTVVRDTQGLGRGLTLGNDQTSKAPGSAKVRRSIVEGCAGNSVFVVGIPAEIEDTVVRDGRESPGVSGGDDGRGLDVADDAYTGTAADCHVRRGYFSKTRGVAVGAFGGTIAVEDTTIVDTVGAADFAGSGAVGVHVVDAPGFAPTELTLERSLIARTAGWAFEVYSARATVRGSRITATTAGPKGIGGSGVIALVSDGQPHGAAPELTIEGSVIDGSHEVGLVAGGAKLAIAGSAIRHTARRADGAYGVGLWLAREHGIPTEATLSGLLVEDNVQAGLFVRDSQVSIAQSTIRNTAVDYTGVAGNGVTVLGTSAATANVTADRLRIDSSVQCGALVFGGGLTLGRSLIASTRKRPDGSMGDALSAASTSVPATVRVSESLLTGSDRAGMSSFGATIDVADSTFACHPVALDGELHGAQGYVFHDGGGNRCGCDAEWSGCHVLSSSLSPPDAGASDLDPAAQ